MNPDRERPMDPIVYCPYEINYRIYKLSEAEKHVTKCRNKYIQELKRQNKAILWFTCKWNPNHFVPRLEVDFHDEHCPDKDKLMTPTAPTLRPAPATDSLFYRPSRHFQHRLPRAPEPKKEKKLEIIMETTPATETADSSDDDKYEKMVNDYFCLYQPLGLTEQEKNCWLLQLRKSITLSASSPQSSICSSPETDEDISTTSPDDDGEDQQDNGRLNSGKTLFSFRQSPVKQNEVTQPKINEAKLVGILSNGTRPSGTPTRKKVTIVENLPNGFADSDQNRAKFMNNFENEYRPYQSSTNQNENLPSGFADSDQNRAKFMNNFGNEYRPYRSSTNQNENLPNGFAHSDQNQAKFTNNFGNEYRPYQSSPQNETKVIGRLTNESRFSPDYTNQNEVKILQNIPISNGFRQPAPVVIDSEEEKAKKELARQEFLKMARKPATHDGKTKSDVDEFIPRRNLVSSKSVPRRKYI